MLARIDVVTLFPDWFSQLSELGLTGRALVNGTVAFNAWNPRDFTTDRHRSVDDRPYGGGPGMVMRPEPLAAAIEAARRDTAGPVVGMSPQGRPLNQATVRRLASGAGLVLVCGRYEGIDERVTEQLIDEEISLGDFVLSGGEVAAAALIDAIVRLLPGVLGHAESASTDSFEAGLLDWPHYTRPEQWRGSRVPQVLLSGDHARIERWRRQQALGRTWLKRPDLLESLLLSEEDQRLLDEFIQKNRAESDKSG